MDGNDEHAGQRIETGAEAGVETETDPCRNCGSHIEADTVECPECGFNPRRYARWAAGFGILIAGGIIRFYPPLTLAAQILLIGSILLIPGSFFITATTGTDTSET